MWRFERGRFYRVHWNNVPYHPGKTAFLITPKCGNTSVKTALLIARGIDPAKVHRQTETWSPAEVVRSGYRSFAVVRNPYARAVSLWHSKIYKKSKGGLFRKGDFQPGMEFLDFLKEVVKLGEHRDTHVRSQWLGMVHRGRFLPELVVKLEDPGGWDRIRERLPELPALDQRNQSQAPDWQTLCEGEAGEIIRHRWRRDFEMFDYPM